MGKYASKHWINEILDSLGNIRAYIGNARYEIPPLYQFSLESEKNHIKNLKKKLDSTSNSISKFINVLEKRYKKDIQP